MQLCSCFICGFLQSSCSDPLRRAEYLDDFNPSSVVMDKEEVKTVQPRKFVVVLLLSELSGTKTN